MLDRVEIRTVSGPVINEINVICPKKIYGVSSCKGKRWYYYAEKSRCWFFCFVCFWFFKRVISPDHLAKSRLGRLASMPNKVQFIYIKMV